MAERSYWRLPGWEMIACDACLLANADDFPNLVGAARLWALRLRWCHGVDVEVIRTTADEAAREIAHDQAHAPMEALDESFLLFAEGEALASMYAARAAWNAADALHLAMGKTMRAGRGTSMGGRKGSQASKKARRGPNSIRAKILVAQAEYKGGDKAKVATITRKVCASPQYVRRVLKETGN